MAKLVLISLILGLAGLLLEPISVEAKPFFFKVFDVQQSVNTIRTQPQTPVVSTFVLTDFLARKLEFLAGILANTGNASYSVGFSKFGQAAQTTQITTTTTSSPPISTTQVQTVFVPDSTESLVMSSLATTEKSSIGGSQPVMSSVQAEVVFGVGKTSLSATSAPAIIAPTTAVTTAGTTVGTTAGTTAETAKTSTPTSAKLAQTFAPTFGPIFASTTASTAAAATSAGTSAGSATSFAPLSTPTTASALTSTIAPTSASSTLAGLVPSIPPTPESSTDNIIILSLFDQTSGSSSTSAPESASSTVRPLQPLQVTTNQPIGFSVSEAATRKTGYGYSDPNVMLFENSNEIFNDKPVRSTSLERLDLDIRT